MSALKCPTEGCNGLLTQRDIKTNIWCCTESECSRTAVGAAVDNLLSYFMGGLDAISAESGNVRERIIGYEEFLETARPYLHENHYACVIAKRFLSQIYDESSPAEAEKLAAVCRQLLAVFDVLDPGLSQTRALATVRLTEARLMLGDINQEELSEVMEFVCRSDYIIFIYPIFGVIKSAIYAF